MKGKQRLRAEDT